MAAIPNLDFLLDDTQHVLKKLVANAPFLENYVLVGGSAIALHLRHRMSEDLDFFTWNASSFTQPDIRVYLGQWQHKEIINLSNQQIDVVLNGVKVTFFNSAWPFLTPANKQPLNLAPLESLAAMKVHTLFVRAKFRDYYDLYFLVKKLGLNSVFNAASQLVDGLTQKLFYTALTYIDDIEDDTIDHLEPAIHLDKTEIRQFFEAKINQDGV